MVLDALAAFALACNVLQAIEHGSKILSKAIEYGKSESGLLIEHQALEEVAADLSAITMELESSLPTSATANSGLAHVKKASETCSRLSRDFLEFLNRFKIHGNSSLWNRLGKTMKLAWRKEKMVVMQEAVAEARDNLQISFLLFSHAHLEQMISESSSRLGIEIASRVQEILRSPVRQESRASTEQSLSDMLSRLELGNVEHHNASIQLMHNCKRDLQRLSAHCSMLSANANAQRSSAYAETALQAQRTILDQLYFVEIHDREEHITPAHRSTFGWALESPVLSGQRSVNSWLDSELDEDRMLWISGKPGSGKSTLLKHLINNLADTKPSDPTSGPQRTITIKVFFWKSGNIIQRSWEGLLRNILFQLSEFNSNYLDDATPKRIWEHVNLAIESKSPLEASKYVWSASEMERAVHIILSRINQRSRVLVVLDGLDEFGEEPQERHKLTDFIQSLKAYQSVKMICSSRPWVIFNDFFKYAPQLRLQDLTKGDILRYVQDTLGSDKHFQRACLNNPETARSLVTSIVDNAQGVFIWVYLVVRELSISAQHGESIRMLRSRFDQIPTNLNDYFRKIMHGIEPKYVREASALLQIQLRYIKAGYCQGLDSVQPRLLDVSFLDLHRLDFAWDKNFLPDFSIDSVTDREIMEELMQRRVNSRCMGLLEVRRGGAPFESDSHTALDVFGSRLEFFHRSFADFLSEEADHVLYGHTGGKFEVGLYRLNAYQVLIDGLTDKTSAVRQSLLYRILYEIGTLTAQHPHLMDDMACWVRRALGRLVSEYYGGSEHLLPREVSLGWPEISNLVRLWHESPETYITDIAVSYGWVPWVKEHVTLDDVRSRRGRPLLFYCLSPAGYDHRGAGNLRSLRVHRNWSHIASVLLLKGVDPNEEYDGIRTASLILTNLDSFPQKWERSERHIIIDVVAELCRYGALLKGWHLTEEALEFSARGASQYTISSFLASRGFGPTELEPLRLIEQEQDRSSNNRSEQDNTSDLIGEESSNKTSRTRPKQPERSPQLEREEHKPSKRRRRG